MVPRLLDDVARVRLPGGQPAQLRVLSVEADILLVAGSEELPLDRANSLCVVLATERGPLWWDAVVVGPVDRPRQGVMLRLIGEPQAAERRQSVRAPVHLAVDIAPAGEDMVPGRLVEVSRDSLRVEAPVRLLPGDLVQLVVHLPGQPSVRLTASVVRRVAEGDFALTFELIATDGRDGLVRFAFERLLDAA